MRMVQEQFENSKMKKIVMILLSMCCITAHAQLSDVNVGDIVDIDGIKGIVFQVDETGSHGVLMSINCLRGISGTWCNDKKIAKDMPVPKSETDGRSNTQMVTEYAKSRNALNKFPVFEWCAKLGEGWYIPSYKELEAFVNYWLGNEQIIDWDSEEEVVIEDNRPFYKQVNEKMIEAGGVPFLNGVCTSTINDDGKVYVFWFDRQKNSFSFKTWAKGGSFNKYIVGRAFYKF